MKKNISYDCPPYLYLKKVLETYPKAGFTYLLLWENKGHSYQVNLHKQQIRDDYLMHYGRFHHDLSQLAKLNLLTFQEYDKKVTVDLKPPVKEGHKGYCPC